MAGCPDDSHPVNPHPVNPHRTVHTWTIHTRAIHTRAIHTPDFSHPGISHLSLFMFAYASEKKRKKRTVKSTNKVTEIHIYIYIKKKMDQGFFSSLSLRFLALNQ